MLGQLCSLQPRRGSGRAARRPSSPGADRRLAHDEPEGPPETAFRSASGPFAFGEEREVMHVMAEFMQPADGLGRRGSVTVIGAMTAPSCAPRARSRTSTTPCRHMRGLEVPAQGRAGIGAARTRRARVAERRCPAAVGISCAVCVWPPRRGRSSQEHAQTQWPPDSRALVPQQQAARADEPRLVRQDHDLHPVAQLRAWSRMRPTWVLTVASDRPAGPRSPRWTAPARPAP